MHRKQSLDEICCGHGVITERRGIPTTSCILLLLQRCHCFRKWRHSGRAPDRRIHSVLTMDACASNGDDSICISRQISRAPRSPRTLRDLSRCTSSIGNSRSLLQVACGTSQRGGTHVGGCAYDAAARAPGGVGGKRTRAARRPATGGRPARQSERRRCVRLLRYRPVELGAAYPAGHSAGSCLPASNDQPSSPQSPCAEPRASRGSGPLRSRRALRVAATYRSAAI